MYIENEDYVMKLEEVVTPTQTAIIRTFHDMVYHTKLEHDAVNNKVRATVYNYLDEIQVGFTAPVVFEYEGQKTDPIPCVNGIAEVDFTTTITGIHVVKTANDNIRNGEVSINV